MGLLALSNNASHIRQLVDNRGVIGQVAKLGGKHGVDKAGTKKTKTNGK